jgi:predicted acylesterase/phospholipase RssA
MEIKEEKKKPSCLVLSGGHIKGIYMLGALHYLQLMGYLENIDTFCGTSVGSIISYFLILGYTPANVLIYLSCNKIDHETINILGLIKNFGLYKFEIIEMHLKKLTMDKLNYIPTLKQLYDITKKKLICITYNQTTQKTLYISHESHPNLDVLMALKMSSNMPLVFEQCIYNGEKYCDGGITDNFAVKYMDQLLEPFHNIIGIEINIESKNPNKSSDNFVNNLFSILNVPLIELHKLRKLGCSDRVKIISLDSSDNTYFNFDLNIRMNTEYFVSGYKQVKTLYEKETDDSFENEFEKYKKD